MMHTLLIHQGFTTPTDAGGTRHYELARHAITRGDRVSVVASDFGYLSAQRRGGSIIGHREVVDGIELLRVSTSPSLHRGLLGQLMAFCTFALASLVAGLRVRDVDVVLATSPPLFQAFSAWLVSAVKQRPLVLEIRDLWPDFIIEMGKLTNPLAIFLARRVERFLYWRADRFIVNSPAYVDYLTSKGVARAVITLIPNGADPSMFVEGPEIEKSAAAIRTRYGLTEKFVAMYAGAMGPANNLEVLLEAAAKLRSESRIHIVLVGGGKSRDQLERRARDLDLDNVTFAGPQSKADMCAFLHAADVCVATLQDISMFRLTYPNKVFDYLAAGRPIVLGIDGVIREVVEDARAGMFVQPGNATALAAAIQLLSNEPESGRAMGKRGRAYLERRFNRRDHGELFTNTLRRASRVR
jgi:glycosyltransferase involved in cell wall biosynthesis